MTIKQCTCEFVQYTSNATSLSCEMQKQCFHLVENAVFLFLRKTEVRSDCTENRSRRRLCSL